jgi:hypothetical protein
LEKMMETNLRLVGLFLILLNVVLIWASRLGGLQRVENLPNGFKAPILALELVPNIAAVEKIVGPADDPRRQQVHDSLWIDNRIIIPAYTLLFILMGQALGMVGSRFASWLTLVAGLTTALADYVENHFLSRVLDDGSGQLPLVRSAQFAACVKWGLFFATTALVAAYLVQHTQLQFKLIGFAYLISGLTGLLGSLAVFSGRIYPKAFEWPVPVIFLATILFAFLLLSQPQRFADTAPTS